MFAARILQSPALPSAWFRSRGSKKIKKKEFKQNKIKEICLICLIPASSYSSRFYTGQKSKWPLPKGK